MSCHKAFTELNEKTDLMIALAGNPNVGKSCVFNQLTGLGVLTANYPSKTVELNMGVTTHNGLKIGMIDLPSTYAISAFSDDQWVARRGVLEGRPNVVVVVVDACNLQRNLYMALQFLELGFTLTIYILSWLLGYQDPLTHTSGHILAPIGLGSAVCLFVMVVGEDYSGFLFHLKFCDYYFLGVPKYSLGSPKP